VTTPTGERAATGRDTGPDPDHHGGERSRDDVAPPPPVTAGTGPAGPGDPDRPPRPRWERPAVGGLLVATAALYLWNLGASGWANAFYAAAAQAGSESWKAFFFGSFDAANAITVDKTPASVWVMALSARVFGVSSWSLLVPQALMGVGTVALVRASVRRWFSPGAALLAGAAMALTPVAALMFRFDNPDALLVLLLTGAAYAVVRALERGGTRWLMLAGVLIGFGFLSKMLQAFLVVPAFALVYLIAAPTPLRRRLVDLVLAGVAMFAASAWWVAIVELWPASSRPYIGGSQSNSILELIVGYNGLGRLTGDEVGSVGGGAGPGGMWGETGIARMFDGESGGQIAWLIPAALVMTAAMFWLAGRAPRTDRLRASALLWAGWLVLTGLTFSFMAGIFHAYYTVALAPAISALVGIGAGELWRRRRDVVPRVLLAVAVGVTAVWSAVVLDRTPDWMPWVRVTIAVAGVAAVAGLLLPPARRRTAIAAAGLGLVAALLGPASYAVATAAQPHTGSIPSAGPAAAAQLGGPGGGRGGGPRGQGGNGFAPPPGGFGGPGQPPGQPPGQLQGRAPGGFGGNGAGGLLDASTPSAELTSALLADAGSYTWVAAAVGSQTASGYQLATGRPVIAVGGFNGSDPAPTLAQFQQWVAEGRVHYFVGSGGFGGGRQNGGSSASSEIAAWVQENFTATTVGGVTLYDLSSGGAATGSA
jgi:4-amino-4-deoxy-L-arabinose transferase-like glycosyltransferase